LRANKKPPQGKSISWRRHIGPSGNPLSSFSPEDLGWVIGLIKYPVEKTIIHEPNNSK
jgi:hypothetical protein